MHSWGCQRTMMINSIGLMELSWTMIAGDQEVSPVKKEIAIHNFKYLFCSQSQITIWALKVVAPCSLEQVVGMMPIAASLLMAMFVKGPPIRDNLLRPNPLQCQKAIVQKDTLSFEVIVTN